MKKETTKHIKITVYKQKNYFKYINKNIKELYIIAMYVATWTKTFGILRISNTIIFLKKIVLHIFFNFVNTQFFLSYVGTQIWVICQVPIIILILTMQS